MANRLANEKSPYLMQHASNPVDWYPWGLEAFEQAKKQNKPIFLSIGYATCHWCHVMEKESFTDPEIAKLMNETFINIKVDREELPSVDNLYMDFAQAMMATSGGWPLNLILTPELKPFFAITYLPPKTRRGLLGFEQFIMHIKQLWESDEKTQVLEQADKIVEAFTEAIPVTGTDLPTPQHLQKATETLFEMVDPIFGGLKGEPKFPLGYQSDFFLDYAQLKGDGRALFFVDITLNRIHNGGIHDHLGGGFYRYCIDAKWAIPHFEKMLYDNSLLASAYLKAWQYTKNPFYREVCEEILDYILREMMSPEGGGYSAQDADLDGKEGLYYTWTPSEVREVLTPSDADIFCNFYGVTAEGNFEGRSILHAATSLEEFSKLIAMPPETLHGILASCREKLFQKRNTRPRPFVDDKIITSWNGLMLSALAKAGKILSKDNYSQAAIKTAEFICQNLKKDGHLFRRYRDKEARFSGILDDYAFLIKAFLDMSTWGYGTKWLNFAIELTETAEKEFKAERGAFYLSSKDDNIILRKCEFYDGAEPSSNAVHTENLLRLYQITHNEKYLSQAEDIFKAERNFLEAYPPGACYHLIALQRYFDHRAPVVVVAFNESQGLKKEIENLLTFYFSTHREVIWKFKDDNLIGAIVPLDDKVPIDGKTTVYICTQKGCLAPISDLKTLEKTLETL